MGKVSVTVTFQDMTQILRSTLEFMIGHISVHQDRTKKKE